MSVVIHTGGLNQALFKAASHFERPAWAAREYAVQVSGSTSNALNRTKTERGAFILKTAVCTIAAIPTAPLALVLKKIAIKYRTKPFTYKQGSQSIVKKDIQTQITLLWWNICAIRGGYNYTDGGVAPWRDRIKPIINEILNQNADVICLGEVFNPLVDKNLYEGLKNTYKYFYLNIGPKTIGVSSGLFVASKIALSNPNFVPFSKEILIGSAKFSEKGYFSFTVGGTFRVIATHLQHSAVFQKPTVQEKYCRAEQMNLIFEEIGDFDLDLDLDSKEASLTLLNRATILTGDFNMPLKEMANYTFFNRTSGAVDEITWGGEAVFVEEPSDSQTLDYTLAIDDSATVVTEVIDVGFNRQVYNKDALSDHNILKSTITL